MTPIDPQLLEQLSAWMDGELPSDEARFLQRRLRNDVALREQWERWQLASACLNREPVHAMAGDLPRRIAAAIADAGMQAPARRPRMAWLASAAALVLAVALLPGILAVDPRRPAAPATDLPVAAVPLPPRVSPTPDLAADPDPPMSPLPSVRDFPLVANGAKAWPRSPLLADPRVRDGLLIRNDGPFLPLRDAEPAAAGQADPQ